MEGAAERLILALQGILDEKWLQWIAWPLQMINSTAHAS
jgi:hypothetical protein